MTPQSGACLIGQGWGLGPMGAQVESFDEIIQTNEPGHVQEVINILSERLASGCIAIGFLAYEAGAAFGLPVNQNYGPNFPLVWFGIASSQSINCFESWPEQFSGESQCHLKEIHAEPYDKSVQAIKDYIAAGDTYQVNYTVRASAIVNGSSHALFRTLYESQPCPYAAFIETDEQTILSLSPELFLHRNGDSILSRPMKGTIRRGRFNQEDDELKIRLQKSDKERAENIMIVDMMRNDLGRICKFGSVEAKNLFQTERYRTLWQMTSEVSGHVSQSTSLYDILAATFPAASITGAPKYRTMQIIHDLEQEPRCVYCGAVGFFRSEQDFTMNVAIRTLRGKRNGYVLGLGGGIVWDSNNHAEREELNVKAQFVTNHVPEFELIETMRHSQQEGFAFLEDHLQRMFDSAKYWDFPFEYEEILNAVNRYKSKIDLDECAVRLALNDKGVVSITHRELTKISDRVAVRFSEIPINSRDRFYFHKTTNRELYNQERKNAVKSGVFEVLFVNENNHVTEGTITNLFYRIGKDWFTPPVTDGLLPGVWRRQFMNENQAIERSISLEVFWHVDEIRLGNSVIGDVKIHQIDHNSI